MANGRLAVYVERGGKIHKTEAEFKSEEDLRRTIDKIVARVGRRVDDASPYVDARLADVAGPDAVELLPAVDVKGFADPVAAFRLRG